MKLKHTLRLIVFATMAASAQQSTLAYDIEFSADQMQGVQGFSGGVSWMSQTAGGMSILLANAHLGQNVIHLLARAPGGFSLGHAQLFPGQPIEPASTSALCWGYGPDKSILVAEANQNGESNRIFLVSETEMKELPHPELSGGDNYHCSIENLGSRDKRQLLLSDLQGSPKVFEISAGAVTSFSGDEAYPWTIGRQRTSGMAAGDFDLDGWHDLFVASPSGPDTIYKNAGYGKFHRHEQEACPFDTGEGLSSGGSWIDIDNDGDPDLVISKLGAPNVVLENDKGCFVASAQPQISLSGYQTWASAAADFDLDGDMDIAFGNYDGPIQIFENVGGLFRLAQEISHPDMKPGGSSGIAAGDADLDGYPDLAVAFWDERSNLLLKNASQHAHRPNQISLKVIDGNSRPLFNVSAVVHYANGRSLYLHTAGATGFRSQSAPIMSTGLSENSELSEVDIWFEGKKVVTCKSLVGDLTIDLQHTDPC